MGDGTGLGAEERLVALGMAGDTIMGPQVYVPRELPLCKPLPTLDTGSTARMRRAECRGRRQGGLAGEAGVAKGRPTWTTGVSCSF